MRFRREACPKPAELSLLEGCFFSARNDDYDSDHHSLLRAAIRCVPSLACLSDRLLAASTC